MAKGSPRFPADPDVRNVFSPAKGSKYACLDYIILHRGQVYEYSNDNPESVFVLIECCLKSPEQGAREGASFIRSQLIETADRAFDDFAGTNVDSRRLRRILGLD